MPRSLSALGFGFTTLAGLSACFMTIDESKIGSRLSSDAGASSSSSGSGSETGPKSDASASNNGLLGQWDFEDQPPGETAVDSSGHGHDGVLHQPIGHTVGIGTGRAITTDQTITLRDDLVGFFDVPSLKGAAFPQAGTLSFWFRELATTGDGFLFGVETTGPRFEIVATAADNSATTTVTAFDASSTSIGTATFTIGILTWTHLALVWDQKKALVFFGADGQPLTTQTITYAHDFTPSDQTFRFLNGSVDGQTEGALGDLDAVRLYDRALGTDEINTLR